MVTPPLLLCNTAGRVLQDQDCKLGHDGEHVHAGDIVVWSTCVPGNNYMHVKHAILENANEACCASNRCGSTGGDC